MSTLKRLYNFNPGPSTLPAGVIQKIKDNFTEFGGMSVLEISHRSKEFEKILNDTKLLLTELMGIPKNYHILFLQGGASLQFAMAPLNLMDRSADYAVTGYWSQKAVKEADIIGRANIVFSSEGENFSRIPAADEIKSTEDASYLHITSNNTIFGTQYREFPETGDIPLVADMSSDILSRELDVSKFGLIYAGAQKNLGPAGVTVVIIRDDLLERNYRKLPAMLRYSTHAEGNSLYNTPPVFAIYVMRLVLLWLKEEGGIKAIEAGNMKKAEMIYNVIDASGFYKGNAEKKSRSMMNVTFTLPNDELTEKFVIQAKERGMAGLKGHRLVGGVRASIYNAFPAGGVEALIRFMREFERTGG